MKKTLISTAVVAAVVVLGGGYYLWPATDNSPRVSETKSVVSKNKVSSKDTSTTAAKKASVTSSSSSESSTTADATSSSSTSNSTSNLTASSSTNSSTTSATTSPSTSSSAATTISQAGATSASQSVVTSHQSARQLTAAQVNDWAWQQVALQYQNTNATKQDFSFNQYQQAGLVYVEVYENQNTGVAHLAGRFRVNAQGQLEQQQISKGDIWQVVATAPTN